LRGVPAYSVSMAVGRSHLADIEEGLVRDLVSGATYYAAKGQGAKLNGRPIRVHAYNPKDLLFTVYLGSNAHSDAARVAGLARRVRNLGAASLDLCLVARAAAGRLDGEQRCPASWPPGREGAGRHAAPGVRQGCAAARRTRCRIRPLRVTPLPARRTCPSWPNTCQ